MKLEINQIVIDDNPTVSVKVDDVELETVEDGTLRCSDCYFGGFCKYSPCSGFDVVFKEKSKNDNYAR